MGNWKWKIQLATVVRNFKGETAVFISHLKRAHPNPGLSGELFSSMDKLEFVGEFSLSHAARDSIPGVCRPVLAENAPLEHFPGARTL